MKKRRPDAVEWDAITERNAHILVSGLPKRFLERLAEAREMTPAERKAMEHAAVELDDSIKQAIENRDQAVLIDKLLEVIFFNSFDECYHRLKNKTPMHERRATIDQWEKEALELRKSRTNESGHHD
jgi:hypothetical protein